MFSPFQTKFFWMCKKNNATHPILLQEQPFMSKDRVDRSGTCFIWLKLLF